MPRAENEAALAWLAGALEQCYSLGLTTLASHLEAVLEEVVWELAVSERRRGGRGDR